jgi:hypothetical protein
VVVRNIRNRIDERGDVDHREYGHE